MYIHNTKGITINVLGAKIEKIEKKKLGGRSPGKKFSKEIFQKAFVEKVSTFSLYKLEKTYQAEHPLAIQGEKINLFIFESSSTPRIIIGRPLT